ncbi:MAG: peroxide stress protein YaaA [Lewinella sp.]
MLILLSPAKTLDMSSVDVPASSPRVLDDTQQLMSGLRRKSEADLMELMSISEKLAALNHERFQKFEEGVAGKPALLAFQGDVYQDLQASDFNERELDFADQQIRILSGLYGLLRPRDLMQAYRLEMGTNLDTRCGSNLYEFWGEKITDLLNEDLQQDGTDLVLNLASKEYTKSLQEDRIKGRILNVQFKERRDGKLRFITYNGKRARGMMARLITLEGIREAEPLKELVVNDYVYSAEHSTEHDWMYIKG